MKVKMILKKNQPIQDYPDEYAARLIEQGKAIAAEETKGENEPAPRGKKRAGADGA